MPIRRIAGAVLLFVLAGSAGAQDIGVRTEIYNEAAGKAGKPAGRALVGRSTALFHAGKIYDSVDSRVMTIFEPAQNQITIIDGSARTMAVVSFEEIEDTLEQVIHRTELEAVEIQKSRDPAKVKAARLFRFCAHPQFEERYTTGDRRMELKSEWMTYTVQCEKPRLPEFVKTYLEFADSAARLNYLVNPQAPLPGPRLELNKALARRNVLPSKVTVKWHTRELHLTAEHRFHWKFDPDERERIRYWEQLSQAPDIKRVSLEKLLESQQTTARR